MKRKNIIRVKDVKSPAKRRQSNFIARQPADRVKMEMSALVSAVESALDPVNSDRLELISMYENAWKDSRVIAETDKADSYLVTEPFSIMNGGAANAEKKKLFARPWFSDFMRIAMRVEFWGYTLVEFQLQDENGEFTDVKIFPRRHVRPFEKLIVSEPSMQTGVSYAEKPSQLFLIELGDPEVLGKLETITREIIWKTFARSDWSEYNERYGKPFLDFATDSADENEIRKKEEMASKFGSNLWLVRDIEDEVNITTVASRASSENFRDLAKFCDDQIALLINGQLATSDEKSFVGSAMVQERVMNTFTEARLLRIQNTVNYTLIPFLIEHGYPLDGGDTIMFDSLDEEKRKNERDHLSRQGVRKNEPDEGDGFNSRAGFFV